MKFSQGHWTFLGLGDHRKWCGTLLHTLEGKWNSAATGHSVFKSFSALSRGILNKKNGRDTLHFNADVSTSEFHFRIIRSVNQLSIFGAVSNWCEQFCLIVDEKGQERNLEKGESVNQEMP